MTQGKQQAGAGARTGGGYQRSGYQQNQQKQQKQQNLTAGCAGCWDWVAKPTKPIRTSIKQQAGARTLVKVKEKDKVKSKPKAMRMNLLLPAANLPPHLLRRREYLKENATKTKRSTANPSFGWSLRAPQKGRARHLLLEKCGNSCFLLPEREAFPVCAKYDLKRKCEVDCRGVLSAYRRAQQYKYPDVAERAKTLARSKKCSWIK